MKSEAVNRSQIDSQKTVPLLYGEHRITKQKKPVNKADENLGIPGKGSCFDYFCCCFPCLRKYMGQP